MYKPSEIEGEQAFPIFFVGYGFVCDGEQEYKDKYPQWYEGLPDGRVRHSWVFDYMSKEPITIEQLYVEKDKVFEEFCAKNNYQNVSDVKKDIYFIRNETWCSTWFCHYRFDLGETDEQILVSFDRYVDRMQCLNEKLRYEQGTNQYDTPKGGVCLMGAEDRWRWRGENDGPAPCRCDGCKKYGVIRINH